VIGGYMTGLSPRMAMILLTLMFFFIHYMFASVTAHVTAVLPVMLAVGSAIPGIDMPQFAMMLCGTLGIMGIQTPYATGPSPVYYGSGYLPSADYWRMGAIFGVIFIGAYLLICVPWFAFLY
jgi:L-tartrate/succinate antiporter